MGIFVLVEMLLFQDYIGNIPVAVFVGILFKVGYDVFDWHPIVSYLKKVFGQQESAAKLKVQHVDMFFIVCTTGVTLAKDLNTAVVALTILFYLVRIWVKLPDLETTEGVGEETAT